MSEGASLTLHASCVASGGRGILILGPSGSGKSTLALALMALGARLVADDRTILAPRGDAVHATCPPALRGLIEARGLGLLNAEPMDGADLSLVVDLAVTETERLPPHRSATYFGRTVDLVQAQRNPHFPAALMAYLSGGRRS
jgi:HPr kinase/phosphorylase